MPEQVVRNVCFKLKPYTALKGDVLFREGEVGREMVRAHTSSPLRALARRAHATRTQNTRAGVIITRHDLAVRCLTI